MAMAICDPRKCLVKRSATTKKHKSGEVIARRWLQNQEGVISVCGAEFRRLVHGVAFAWRESRGESMTESLWQCRVDLQP